MVPCGSPWLRATPARTGPAASTAAPAAAAGPAFPARTAAPAIGRRAELDVYPGGRAPWVRLAGRPDLRSNAALIAAQFHPKFGPGRWGVPPVIHRHYIVPSRFDTRMC